MKCHYKYRGTMSRPREERIRSLASEAGQRDRARPRGAGRRRLGANVRWKDLKPVRAGRFLVHGSHDPRSAGAIADIGIEIEAGLAFGTGHTATRLGCLEMIDTRRDARGALRNTLDLGTGSAVLAIGLAETDTQIPGWANSTSTRWRSKCAREQPCTSTAASCSYVENFAAATCFHHSGFFAAVRPSST